MFKGNTAAAAHKKVARFGVIIIAVAPAAHLCSPVTHLSVRLGIKKPKRNINAFNFVYMVLVLKNFRQQPLARKVILKPRLGGFFI